MKILKFTASWCGPCQAMKKARTLEKLAEKYGLELELHDVDTKKGDATADRFGVTAIPTMVLTGARGKELARIEGSASLAMLEKKFGRHLPPQ